MSIDDAVRAAYRGYRSRPSDILPYYLLGLATPAIAQTVMLVGILSGYLVMLSQNTLEPILTEVETLGPFSIDDPGMGPGQQNGQTMIDGQSTDTLVTAAENALTPELLAVGALTIVSLALALFLINAVVSTGQVHAVYAVLRNRPGLRAGVDGIARDYRRFVGLALLEIGLMALVTGVLIGGVAAAWFLVSEAIGVLVGLLAALVWLPLILFIWVAFLFAPQAVVVEDVGVFAAVRRNLGFVRNNLLTTGLYVVLLIAVGVVTSTLTGLFQFIGTPTLAALVSSLAVIPLLDFVKTWLFASERTEHTLVPRPRERGIGARFVAALRRGWAELTTFVRSTPTYHVASTAIFVVSGYAGWLFSARLDPVFQASIANRLVGWFPPVEAINLTANNWQVGVAQAYSGLAAGIPTIVTLFYNGFFLGAIARFETNTAELIAFVVPHGIIEIPSLLIAGALGLYLGRSALRLARGRHGREAITGDIERAYHVLVGLLLLFAVAGLIEAFVSPYYSGLIGL